LAKYKEEGMTGREKRIRRNTGILPLPEGIAKAKLSPARNGRRSALPAAQQTLLQAGIETPDMIEDAQDAWLAVRGHSDGMETLL